MPSFLLKPWELNYQMQVIHAKVIDSLTDKEKRAFDQCMEILSAYEVDYFDYRA